MNKHIFALYIPELTHLLAQDTQHLTIKDKNFFHRIAHVLRLQIGDEIQLFDQQQHILTKLKQIQKKDTVIFVIESIRNNMPLLPHITLLLPVLKKEALEQAINNATQLGATVIQLVATQKMQRKWHGKKELERLQKIIIAAAEQAKNYTFPDILEPITLQESIEKYEDTKFFFADHHGETLFPLVKDLSKEELDTIHITLAIGPEADLNLDEKLLLKKVGIIFVRLTNTILRAEQAASLLLGIFRALL